MEPLTVDLPAWVCICCWLSHDFLFPKQSVIHSTMPAAARSTGQYELVAARLSNVHIHTVRDKPRALVVNSRNT